jgi:hypothetical protein
MTAIEKNEQYYKQLYDQYVQCARETDALAELCSLRDYHPDHGRVPEFWKPIYAQFFEKARDIGAAQVLQAAQPVELPVPEIDDAEERLADLLGWSEQPKRPGELYHRWQTPRGSVISSRPHWSSESKDAFNLAAEMEISTSYKDGCAIASFTAASGQAFQVRQAVDNFKDTASAMRNAIVLASIGKLEHALEPQAKAHDKTSPSMGL